VGVQRRKSGVLRRRGRRRRLSRPLRLAPALSRGASNHWGGRSRHFERFDFDARPELGLAAWPIGYDDFAAYLPEARRLCELPDFAVDREPVEGGADRLERIVYRHSGGPFDGPPTHFGEEYRSALDSSETVELLLNANALDLIGRPDRDRVEGVAAAAYDGDRFDARGDAVALAMGGIENARFLLHANAGAADRYGNAGGWVGRGFMDHPSCDFGLYFITRRLYSHLPDFGVQTLYRRQKPELIVAPTEAAIRDAGVANFHVRFQRLESRALTEEEIGGAPMIRDLRFGEDYFFVGDLFCTVEQLPLWESRVGLIDEIDPLGMRRVLLDMRVDPNAERTIRFAAEETARMLVRSGLGRARFDDWLVAGEPAPFYSSNHHIGTTRMAAAATDGVVDADCRVHGTENLFCAGSSVFPRAGHCNPTLNLVALALRLADHLDAVADRQA
jgi:hypothetical protein